ncbi:MAG: hypothetical protein JEZ09_00630 [Salinivirgaceae bacterium]|nr:hypothetical protein [Salinivirgaceae bacterium]
MSLPKKFSRLTINELGTTAHRINDASKDLNLPVYASFQTALENYDTSLSRSATSAENVAMDDAGRDSALKEIIKLSEAYTYHYNAQVVELANTVSNIIQKYGGHEMARRSYKEETSLIKLVVKENNKLSETYDLNLINIPQCPYVSLHKFNVLLHSSSVSVH